jgi:hypothetical protein
MYDIIGDIHGYADHLEKLLQTLGYSKTGGSYRHPERKVLFVGDYIDRGPKIRETLHLVRNMAEAGHAIALMGNHEFNAIAFNTKNTEGGYLRKHDIKNISQHYETMKQFHGNQEEYESFIEWFKELPLYFENEQFRAVHASWDQSQIEFLKMEINKKFSDENIKNSTTMGSNLYQAIEDVLKGKEINLPSGITFKDKDGNERENIRIKWWENPVELNYYQYAVKPFPGLSTEPVSINNTNDVKTYSCDDKPVFFGHYWLEGTPGLFKPNVCCVDFSVAKGGVLTAYRYNGEKDLSVKNLFWV